MSEVVFKKMRYRLGLDLGTSSIGWALLRLDDQGNPCAVIKAGVRIFGDGRNPKDGSSLAVTRRMARAMRRRRDRLLKRKYRLLKLLTEFGFFPSDETARKSLLDQDPLILRSKGVHEALSPSEFARAIFHLNQRRGFKSNRKTDRGADDTGALKGAISQTKQEMVEKKFQTLAQYLIYRRDQGLGVRARYRERRIPKEDGKIKIDKSYDLYIDRSMIENEFEVIYAKQASLNPMLFTEEKRLALMDCLLFQRNLKPVKPGRCTLLPEKERAPLALPSVQQFRIYQELNNLRLIGDDHSSEQPITKAQRDAAFDLLNRQAKATFGKLKSIMQIDKALVFNLEDVKRIELKGNTTTALLSKEDFFGLAWLDLPLDEQDAVVLKLLNEENEHQLIKELTSRYSCSLEQAEKIVNVSLAEGYGSLSKEAIDAILPQLSEDVVTYAQAVIAAGFDHHSNISSSVSGEILPSLPYYGEPLQRHVGFGTGVLDDSPEKRFGRIANPTVHIGLNQVRLVVNKIVEKYGHPTEVVVEVARDLKQSREQRKETQKQQAENQKRNERIREDISKQTAIPLERVTKADIQKVILWEELALNPLERLCPYSGKLISFQMLMSPEVEIEHILPFSRTLDDSLNNKTVSLRSANRIKGSRTPFEAKDDFQKEGWFYEDLLERVKTVPKQKRYRYGPDGYQKWLREDKDFLARALNDTRYLSKVAREYLSLICPQATRVIPGQMTAMLRGKFGLNEILGKGEKNREDHRHHAIDACVVAVTDQGLLQRFSTASKSARDQQLNRLVGEMPTPWPRYFESVREAVEAIRVSHRPDHSHEGAMHNDTAYSIKVEGVATVRKVGEDGRRYRETSPLKVIPFSSTKDPKRHGLTESGELKPYKGYKGDSNYCMEIYRDESGKWQSEVISTFGAYQIARREGPQRLRDKHTAQNGRPLVMRLMRNDCISLASRSEKMIFKICKLGSNGSIFLAELIESNVDARVRNKELRYVTKTAGGLQKDRAKIATVDPIGMVSFH
jgi:CRISPR-associated endonuclease Csn1